MVGYRKVLVPLGVAAFAASVLTGAARAEQGEFLRDALSNLGLVEAERPPITYRERAPLVMPPKLGAKAIDTRSLPQPRALEATPQWPKDPEVARRERAVVEARKPIVRGAQGRMDDNNMTLSIDEMQAGRRAGAQIPTEGQRKPEDGSRGDSFWSNPFGLTGGEKTEPVEAAPTREVLTQPPTDYRRAPTKVARTNGDPINNPSREREEADPGLYVRGQSRY
ncbi:hypothetical protein ASG40_02230 [Methylobacterium sp. Leaf399]|uniref:hypothetical protein n=1 Tax=Methylobacterium sp. Leaf399 TaxID=1736364 RepID=UPI0006F4E65E|nr:hypothetical protein [Methylobacterium sp. Leaf399]KQT19665.1 hypothetical protein ASG40_02230 [Methylobacterium sp. Leaf399]